MEKLLFRYGLPGIPSTLTIYVALIFLSQTRILNIDPSSAAIITTISVSTILFGYFYYQAWLLIFEGTSMSYKSKSRKALCKINDKNIPSKLNNDDLYSIWENVLYRNGEKEKEIFKKDKGMWSFYHQNKSFVLGNLSSAIISFFLILFLPGLGYLNSWLFIIPGIQIVFGILAEIKARQTYSLIEIFECGLVDTWAIDFSKAVEIVVNSRKFPDSKQKIGKI